MTKLITSNFKVNAAKQLKESISEPDGNQYYLFAARHVDWDNDLSPPNVVNSQHSKFYDPYDHMIFGKLVAEGDVKHAVRKYMWTSGTVYTMYDDTVDISNKQYFVVVNDVDGQYSIFKCLDNNSDSQSTQVPTIADMGGKVGASNYSDIYQTVADGYVWKYMGGITDSDYERFSTADYIPIDVNANVVSNAIDGSIDAIKMLTTGAIYDKHQRGYFREVAFNGVTTRFILSNDAEAQNNYYDGASIYIPDTGEQRTITSYQVVAANTNAPTNSLSFTGYKRIDINNAFSTLPSTSNQYVIAPKVNIQGDGSGADARAVVNTAANTISQIIMLNRGTGYTHAVVSIPNLSANSSAVNATARAIISPPGGHGSDVLNELEASQLIFSVKFANNENNTISVVNDYRKVGLLKDPLFANVRINYSVSSGGLQDGRYVRGVTSNAYGEIISVPTSGNYIDVGGLNKKPISGETMNEEYANGQTTGVTLTVTTGTTSQGRDTINQDTFVQSTRLTTQVSGSGNFSEDDYVEENIDALVQANGYIQQVLTNGADTLIDLTNIRGIFQASDAASGSFDGLLRIDGLTTPTANISAVTLPDLKKNSGEVLYIENIQPVTRSDLQTETTNLVIKF